MSKILAPLCALVVVFALLHSALLAHTAATAPTASDLTGTWTGKLKSTPFNASGAGKAQNGTITLTISQSAAPSGQPIAQLTATVTVSGNSTPFSVSGQTGNTNLWLMGTSGADTLVLSAHVDKKGATMKGVGIVYNQDGDEELSFTAKK